MPAFAPAWRGRLLTLLHALSPPAAGSSPPVFILGFVSHLLLQLDVKMSVFPSPSLLFLSPQPSPLALMPFPTPFLPLSKHRV